MLIKRWWNQGGLFVKIKYDTDLTKEKQLFLLTYCQIVGHYVPKPVQECLEYAHSYNMTVYTKIFCIAIGENGLNSETNMMYSLFSVYKQNNITSSTFIIKKDCRQK